MSARSFAIRIALVSVASAVLTLAMLPGGAEKAAHYLILGGSFVPKDGAVPHVLTMTLAMIVPAACTFAFSDQLDDARARRGLCAYRHPSRLVWARGACIGAAARSLVSALFAYAVAAALLFLLGDGLSPGAMSQVALALPLLALQQAVLALLANALALRLGEVGGVSVILGVHLAALCGLAVAPPAVATKLAPLVPSAQAALAWHGAAHFSLAWSFAYLLVLLLVGGMLAAKALESNELF